MSAIHRVDNEDGLIITTWAGDAIDDALIKVFKKYQEKYQSKPEYVSYNEIVDFTQVSRIRVSIKGLVKIGKLATRTDQFRTMTKVAFIVSSDLAFNIAKLYVTYRNFGKKQKKQIRVFKSESEAFAWARKQVNNENGG